MTVRTFRHSGSGLLATLPLAALGLASLATPARAQTEAAAYGTRAPVQCGPFRSFDGSPAAATRIWQCAYERDALPSATGSLYLLEDMAIQVGAARAYSVVQDMYLTEPDPAGRVYPLRATWTVVQCGVIRDFQPLYNIGSNCNEYYKRGEGSCYRTQFGDWRCSLNGHDVRPASMNIAPRAGGAGQGALKDEPPPGSAGGTIGPMAAVQRAADPPVTDLPPIGQPPVGQPLPGPPAAIPPATIPPVVTAPTGGRRVARDPNRPIGPNDTVIYEDPQMPGQPQRCTVLEVFVGAYRIQCLNRPGRAQFIARDLDVRRPDGTAPQQSAATAPAGPPFRPGDIILASPMGLQAEQYWQLCVVVSNQVMEANSYTVNCGDSRYNVLPDWVRADPEFQ